MGNKRNDVPGEHKEYYNCLVSQFKQKTARVINMCWVIKDDQKRRKESHQIQVERKFNIDAGFTSKDDRLPEFFTKEPLPGSEYVFDVSEEELDSTHN